MKLISHRGNINGCVVEMENNPKYIDNTIHLGYDVEVDIWMVDNNFYLGHDKPQYNVGINWINDRNHKLWMHCKNIEILSFFSLSNYDINYFWHQKDTATLTSKNYIWAYPDRQPIKNSIAVMPELYNNDISQCIGLCSDYIQRYKNETNIQNLRLRL